MQFSMIASATLLVTPVVVAKESGGDDSYLIWMVFASLLVVGVSTLLQVRRLGPAGAGAVLPMFTAAFAIPFCITALVDGGPATLTTLIIASALFQLVISKWLFVLRRVVTPIVSGTVIMILSITLASVVFALLDDAAQEEPIAAPLTALITLVIVVALTLRGTAAMRLWAPVIGIAVGCAAAAGLGIYDIGRVTAAAWVGVPSEWPGLGLDFSVDFWVLVPSFLFLGVIISIQVNGEAISMQRVSTREPRAIDFRRVQGALAGYRHRKPVVGDRRWGPASHKPGCGVFHSDHGGCVAQDWVRHRGRVHTSGVPAESFGAIEHYTGPGDGRVFDTSRRIAFRGRGAHGYPE